MTREELINFGEMFLEVNKDSKNSSTYEFIDMAIKALKQKSTLDKIRAEIDLTQYDFMADKDYDEGIRFGLMLAYQVIDKYKTESE